MRLQQITKQVSMNIPKSDKYYMVEAYNTLRTNLMFSDEKIKIVSLVGCVSGEGTTSVTWNLALSLAETERNVLVIDADMRKSGISELNQEKEMPMGLSEYLSGNCNTDDVLFATPYDHLFILPSGNASANSSVLLSNGRFEVILNETRKMFDYILIDCPPMDNAIDGAVAAKYSDGAVMIVEAEKTKYDLVQNVKIQLEKNSSRILGVVLNKFDAKGCSCYGNYFGKNYGERYKN